MGMHTHPTNEELSLNKLLILYMLNKIELPISNSMLTEFILGNGYTDSFSLQEYLNQMQDAQLIDSTTKSGKTLYAITEQGKTTFEFFENRIPEHIKDLAKDYLTVNRIAIKNTTEILAEYTPLKDDEYMIHCAAKENNRILFEFNLRVYDKETAINMTQSFKENNHMIYKSLLMSLAE